MEGRGDPTERPVVDQRLADGCLRDAVDRGRRVGDQLLHHEAANGDERQSGRRERDERVADRRQEHRPDRDRTDAPASGGTCGDDRADERREATDAGDDPEGRRTQAQFVEDEQEPGRPEDAPQRRERHLGTGESAQDRVMKNQPQAFTDLVEDRLAVRLGRWRLFLLVDRAEQERRAQERQRIEGDRDRCGQELDQEAADSEGHELSCGAARGERCIRVDQVFTLDDRRQVGVVGRIEEGGQDRRQAGHGQELPVGQDAQGERDRDGGQ